LNKISERKSVIGGLAASMNKNPFSEVTNSVPVDPK